MNDHMKAAFQLTSNLFDIAGLTVRELSEIDLPLLQDFFVSNPEYFFAVNGMAPRADEARQEFVSRPPPEIPFNRVYVIGFFDTTGTLVAMTSVTSDFLAKGIWHIDLFVVATALHGSGSASSIYAGIEAWLLKQGVRWVRLGVVAGNIRAEKFWGKSGFIEIRRRPGMQFGIRTQTVRVLVKPIATSGLEEYFSLAARDRPEFGLA